MDAVTVLFWGLRRSLQLASAHCDPIVLRLRIDCCLLLFTAVEYTRVELHPVEGVEGSDYINANYVLVRMCVCMCIHALL